MYAGILYDCIIVSDMLNNDKYAYVCMSDIYDGLQVVVHQNVYTTLSLVMNVSFLLSTYALSISKPIKIILKLFNFPDLISVFTAVQIDK